MSKAFVNALAMALLEEGFIGGDGISLADGKAFAERFHEANPELFTTALAQRMDPRAAPPPPTPQRPPSADDLSEAQSAALASGIGLCPNCQQPNNDHLPGCARATGEDNRAVTKNKLTPVA
jgi:hypothetical protein